MHLHQNLTRDVHNNCEKYCLKFRLHAQALTLAALAGAAVVEYYDHKSGAKAERVAKFLDIKGHQQRD